MEGLLNNSFYSTDENTIKVLGWYENFVFKHLLKFFHLLFTSKVTSTGNLPPKF